jgi:hypothetical protein
MAGVQAAGANTLAPVRIVVRRCENEGELVACALRNTRSLDSRGKKRRVRSG